MSLVEAFSFFFCDFARVCLIFPLLLMGLSCANEGAENKIISASTNHVEMDVNVWDLCFLFTSKF